jgi:geranylgeranyl diphosphate/geranylgeranyl-bacteriochlorophyllide a reductase
VYDVCVVGAGPAGSTLARLIPPHLRVLLVDRRRLDLGFEPGMRGKACGGLLAPAAQRELARQGLGVPTSIMAGPQLFAVRTIDAQAELERHYQRFYLNVDREAFDRWLLSLVPDRVDTLFGFSVHAVDTTQEQPLVRLRGPNGECASVCTRLVVGADGAGSIIASSLGRGLERSGYTAIQGAFEGASTDPYYGAFFDEALTDFYGWSIPKGMRPTSGSLCDTGVVPGRDSMTSSSGSASTGVLSGHHSCVSLHRCDDRPARTMSFWEATRLCSSARQPVLSAPVQRRVSATHLGALASWPGRWKTG